MIHVKIHSIGDTQIEGDFDSLTSVDEQGIFDILPLHSNFISLIKEKIILNGQGKTQTIIISSGVLKATANQVNIFLGL